MSEISFLVGLKNNLEYSKKFYRFFRATFPQEELVFVSFGSTDGTDEWLDSLQDGNLKHYHNSETKSLADTYNKAIETGTKKYVCFLHNDMVLGRNFVREIEKGLKINSLVYYKTVEPPIFAGDNRLWKEIKDFGTDFEDFDAAEFFEFEKENLNSNGIFVENSSFFLAASKENLMKINGLDPLFKPMFCEDDDLILRLKLSGEKPYLFPSAIVYHFVSKTSRFSAEYVNTSQLIEKNSHRNFYRKWGFGNHSTHQNKRTYGLLLSNADLKSVTALEPFVTHIYSDYDSSEYIESEKEKTDFDLSEKFRKLSDTVSDNVILKFNGNQLSEKNLNVFRNLNDLIIARKSQNLKNTITNFLFPKSRTNFKIKAVEFIIQKENLLEKNLIVRKSK